MKRIVFYSILSFIGFLFFGCNDEWKEEQYEKYISFTRSGYVNTYLNYNSEGGVVRYRIPVEVSGTTMNDRTIEVSIALDPDTLDAMNQSRYFTREDLFFRLLEPQNYSFQTMKTTIPAGEEIGYIDIDFKIDNLDLVEKYILPLKIVETSEFIPSPKKWYNRSLMRIIPFNDYSGTYSATGGSITESGSTTPTSVETREMRVVDQNTVFFYAGLTEEDARNRALYKVRASFHALDEALGKGAITLSADSTAIGFTYEPENCYYTVDTRMDDLQPYLQIKTTTMYLKYTYNDVTNPLYSVTYKFNGTYVMERRRNTQIPEQDQQEIFE
ncbi:MAG: DUF4973 domain-containing protein [Paludibacteraceae bacterium]